MHAGLSSQDAPMHFKQVYFRMIRQQDRSEGCWARCRRHVLGAFSICGSLRNKRAGHISARTS
eukprot:4897055-Alexandrium_andersonii.AAC.1